MAKDPQKPRLPKIGLGLKSFPCNIHKTQQFAKALREKKNFKATLLLIGETGAPFREVCEDLSSPKQKESFHFFTQKSFTDKNIKEALKEHSGQKPATFVLLETEALDYSQKEAVFELARRCGRFNRLESSPRIIFCLTEDLDSLYEKGIINDSLYLSMGTSELHIPKLQDIYEEVPALVEQLINQISSSTPELKLTKAAKERIHKQSFPGGYAQLKGLLETAIKLTGNASEIDLEHIETAIAKDPQLCTAPLKEQLEALREDYTKAMLQLCDNDKEKAAKLLKVDTSLIEKIAT